MPVHTVCFAPSRPDIAAHKTYGLMTNAERREDSAVVGSYRVSMAPFSAERAFAVAGGEKPPTTLTVTPTEVAALMIIELAKDEFIIAGFGDTMVGIALAKAAKDGRQAGLLGVDELSFTADGRTVSRRLWRRRDGSRRHRHTHRRGASLPRENVHILSGSPRGIE